MITYILGVYPLRCKDGSYGACACDVMHCPLFLDDLNIVASFHITFFPRWKFLSKQFWVPSIFDIFNNISSIFNKIKCEKSYPKSVILAPIMIKIYMQIVILMNPLPIFEIVMELYSNMIYVKQLARQ